LKAGNGYYTRVYLQKEEENSLSFDSIPANNVVRAHLFLSTYSNDEKNGKLTSKRYEKNLYID
jgi:hypothetical protein